MTVIRWLILIKVLGIRFGVYPFPQCIYDRGILICECDKDEATSDYNPLVGVVFGPHPISWYKIFAVA